MVPGVLTLLTTSVEVRTSNLVTITIYVCLPCIDCGLPITASGVTIRPFASTNIGSVITFQCEDGLIPQDVVAALCGMNGEWTPDPAQHRCSNTSLGTMLFLNRLLIYYEFLSAICGRPMAPENGQIGIYSSTIEGAQITFYCNNNAIEMSAICSMNGRWIPNPAGVDCAHLQGII